MVLPNGQILLINKKTDSEGKTFALPPLSAVRYTNTILIFDLLLKIYFLFISIFLSYNHHRLCDRCCLFCLF